MKQFARSETGFRNIQVLSNPKKSQAAGWNTAIDHYTSDVLIRIDAHASVPADFVSENVRLLESGEAVTGGPRPCKIQDPTPWKETLLLAEESMFGSSIASYRRDTGEEKKYVSSLFHGAYRREVFEKAGRFNERLGRTEDNEMHQRIREAGYRICFSPRIHSWQYARNTLGRMMKQKYGNGYWVALTLKVCPKCLSVFHFVPLAFVLAILVTSVLACFGIFWPLIALWAAYGAAAVLMSALAVRGQKKHPVQLLLPVIFLLLHISYGAGSLAGVMMLPFWKSR